jgi:UDP-galactopyranose mutase
MRLAKFEGNHVITDKDGHMAVGDANSDSVNSHRRKSPVDSARSRARIGKLRDLVCLSHLRWDFIYQRPQHLMSRFARERRVFFVEEPQVEACEAPHWNLLRRGERLWVAVPHLPESLSQENWDNAQSDLIDQLMVRERIVLPALWYYTPMALAFTGHLDSPLVIYDCMDELANFKGAPPRLSQYEARLFERADVVFTGGYSLYEAKRRSHSNMHPFPSSVDVAHFGEARLHPPEPRDQAGLPRPRIGFFGVIDERMDVELLAGIADARPDWQFVLVGPTVKIDPEILPRRNNLRYLGPRSYADLPRYLAGWDVAMLPFAHNESTRYISPTKTPEYLAAGKPVVSTSIRDVVRPYESLGLVRIADSPEDFVRAIDRARADGRDEGWQQSVDRFLSQLSWDRTWRGMNDLMGESLRDHRRLPELA